MFDNVVGADTVNKDETNRQLSFLFRGWMMGNMARKLRGRYLRKAVVYFLTYCMIVNTWLPAVLATPSGGAFTVGTGTIVEGANTAVTVNQAQSIIQWGAPGSGGIDTSAAESLAFSQAAGLSNSAVLNRIMSGNPTQFDGALNALGMNIFIVNPAGIVFGNGSQVNVAQLVASSLDITNQNFLDGRYEFSAGWANGAVINNGAITASEGAALIGQRVLNAGTITTGPAGFVVMAAGDRVLLGEPASNVIVEMDSVTPATPENPEGLGDVINESTGSITALAGTVVLAAGDMFSTALRVESGVGRVVQNGTIHADGTTGATGDGGSVTLTAGDSVVLGTGSLTTANGGTSNSGANGGEVIAYASELYADNALLDFQSGAQIEVTGGSPSNPATVAAGAKFDGGLAELSGDHLYFNGSVDATSQSYQVPDPLNLGSTITVTPEGGTVHIDPVNLTLADGAIPAGGAAMDTFYEKQLEAYSQAGVNTILEADYDITVENISDGEITGDGGDIVLRTAYNTGGIEFLPATAGGPITTAIRTIGGGNIFMLAGSGGIKTGDLKTYEDGANPGRIRIYTNNGGDIETGALTVDGGNDVEVSIIASGNLAINGSVITNTNKVPAEYNKTGTAYICLVSENGSVNILGAVEVEAHGKEETIARIHICADSTVNIQTGNGKVQAIAKTSSTGTADASIRVHTSSSEPGAISITRNSGTPIRIQANTSGSSIGPIDFTGELVDPAYTQDNGGSHVFVQIADAWLEACPDCPTPPDLPPPVEPPQHAPIAVDDNYAIGKGDILLIILDADGVLTNDYDPDDDTIIALLLGGGDTSKGGTVVLQETGGFEYTAPADKQFDTYGTDENGDYALFIDTFEYNLQDEGGLSSNSATVTITAKNYIPVAQGDSYDVLHNVSLSPTAGEGIITGMVPAINGDTDYDGDLLTPYLTGGATAGSTTLGGTVTLNSDGSFAYTPPADTVGTDSFTYYASDGYNNSGSVTVQIELTNTTPVAQADSYDVIHNTNLSPVVEQGVIQGILPAYADSDPDPGDTLTAVLVDGGSTSLGGTVTLNANGSFTYTPPTNQVGADSFSYYVTDGYSNSEPVQVTINLTNTLPVAQPDSYAVGYNMSLSEAVNQGVIVGVVPAVNGDYDPDPGDSLTSLLPGGLTTGPTAQGGTVTLNADGSFSYTPAEGWTGADSFTYYVTDGYGNSEPVLVSMLVGSAPPPPVAPFMQPAPGLERVEIVTSGCPALVTWAAAELGTNESRIQIGIANALASGTNIQACDACTALKQAATILQDVEGTHIAALGQVINEFASSTTPPSEEQMTSIANALAQNVGAANQYATAGEYIDALANYVGVLNSQMGFTTDEAIQLVTDKYVGPLGQSQNAGLSAYVAARLAALGAS